METHKFSGILKEVKRLPGIMTNLEILVEDQKFYRRIIEGPTKKELHKYVGKEVEIEYHLEKTKGSDYWLAKIFLIELNMPKEYNQITGIRELKRE